MKSKFLFSGLLTPFPADRFVISSAPVTVPDFAKRYVCTKFARGASCTLPLRMRMCPVCTIPSQLV